LAFVLPKRISVHSVILSFFGYFGKGSFKITT